jgi:hypothetical protein
MGLIIEICLVQAVFGAIRWLMSVPFEVSLQSVLGPVAPWIGQDGNRG